MVVVVVAFALVYGCSGSHSRTDRWHRADCARARAGRGGGGLFSFIPHFVDLMFTLLLVHMEQICIVLISSTHTHGHVYLRLQRVFIGAHMLGPHIGYRLWTCDMVVLRWAERMHMAVQLPVEQKVRARARARVC